MIWMAVLGLGLVVVFVSYGGYALWVAWLARVRPVPTAARYLPDALLPSAINRAATHICGHPCPPENVYARPPRRPGTRGGPGALYKRVGP